MLTAAGQPGVSLIGVLPEVRRPHSWTPFLAHVTKIPTPSTPPWTLLLFASRLIVRVDVGLGGGGEDDAFFLGRSAVENPEDLVFPLIPDDGHVSGAGGFSAQLQADAGIAELVWAQAHQGAPAADVVAQVGMLQHQADQVGRRRHATRRGHLGGATGEGFAGIGERDHELCSSGVDRWGDYERLLRQNRT